MPTTSAIDPTQTTTTTGRAAPKQTLDKEAFLHLFVEQLRHQDPTAPQDLSQQMAQVSQMSMVEQLTSLAESVQEMAHAGQASHAQALIGRTVTYAGADGPVTGTVERVDLSGDAPTITVSGVDGIDPQVLTEVR
jgi:flagellar basal-body rod modification protein FlgD